MHHRRVPLLAFEGREPDVSPGAWIAPTATLVGEGATIGHLCVVHGAVIGAEALVGNGATVLDGASVGRRP